MTTNDTIEEFAKLLVQQVRDEAIRAYDQRLEPGPKGAIAKRWHAAAADGGANALNAMIPDCVDTVVDDFKDLRSS